MPVTGYPLDAYLVIDNNALVSLCEYFCETNKHLPFEEMVRSVCQEVTGVLDKLRGYAVGNKLFTTGCVQQEFKPECGAIADYPGYAPKHCESLKAHIHREIEILDINMSFIARLRSMGSAPSRFGAGLCRLSDQDLSLVVLALGLAGKFNRRVYILTDEEDLRSFVSWMRARPEVKAICANPLQVEAIHSLTYLDNVHRCCAFTTLFIFQLLAFQLMRHLRRTMLQGTTKGEMITQTFQEMSDAVRASGKIKLVRAQGGMKT